MTRQLAGMCLLAGLAMGLAAIGWTEQQKQREAWSPPSIDEVVKPARRPLTPEEAEKMVKWITDAISLKGWSLDRKNAIRALGDIIGHVAVIPVLEKIARDQQENKDICAAAVWAIARIPDEQAIEALIGILDEAEKTLKQNPKDKRAREVYGAAEEMLRRLLGLPIHLIDSKKSMAENYRDYWEKVQEKIDLRKSVHSLKALTH
ncbi:hypothetical protein HRbin17_02050 [bacterium HR17]|uniref:HEAT repeat domain-containing protein n=1 Tax=Candidatus Fervidibacter japonicus TaxID=2035412 RepID=A0A2H5XEC5_9BACT|nr:hypothetical protein HRbin17_02050 [bacterium HR17]